MEIPDIYQVRYYNPNDYATIAPWWVGHGWDSVPEPILPRPGLVCELNGQPVAAVWLYLSNSNGVAMMEWLVAKPDLLPKKSLQAIKVLIGWVDEECRINNYGVIFTTAKQPGLARILEKSGFVTTDREMIHLIKTL